MYTIEELYDLTHTLAAEYLRGFTYPWEALGGIKDMILALGPALDAEQYAEVSPQVWVHRTATVAPTAYLGAPCIIGAGTEVRHCSVCAWVGAGGGKLRGWQLGGAEKRNPF